MTLLRALAVALAPSAVALRRALADAEESSAAPYRQELQNIGGVYMTDVNIGDNRVKASFDNTASVDLLVFGADCSTCSFPAELDKESSRLNKKDASTKSVSYGSVSYGSGRCSAFSDYDTLELKGLPPRNQSMWIALECKIPQLSMAGDSFNAVISPGSMVDTFSMCFGRIPDSPRYIIWNDKTRKGQPGVAQVNLTGRNTVRSQGMRLTGLSRKPSERDIGCQDGCDVVLDMTSTTIGLPTEVYRKMHGATSVEDCSDLSRVPNLEIDLGGHKFVLSPGTYMIPGKSVPGPNTKVTEFMRNRGEPMPGAQLCRAMVKDNGPGKPVTLGAPFFQQFYTTFSATDNSVFISRASDVCEPESN